MRLLRRSHDLELHGRDEELDKLRGDFARSGKVDHIFEYFKLSFFFVFFLIERLFSNRALSESFASTSLDA